MKDFLKDFASLIIAASLLLGILFLPPEVYEKINGILNFLTKGHETAPAFGNYLVQKIVTGVVFLAITVVLSIAAHRAVKGHFEEKRKLS